MMGRRNAKDVAGVGRRTIVSGSGPPRPGARAHELLEPLHLGKPLRRDAKALMLQTVTPLNKGTKGKLRPLGCAATFRRIAHGPLSERMPRTLPRCSARPSTPWDGKQHWNHCRQTPRRRSRLRATRQWPISIAARHSITRTAR